MRFLAAFCVGAALVSALTAAPVPKGKETEKPKDEDAIQGTWRIKDMDVGAGAVPVPAPFQKLTYVFGEKSAMSMVQGGKAVLEGTIKLDPEAKLKAFDMIRKDGNKVLCLYELDGDTLKLCLTQKPGADRPTEFKGDAQGQTVVFVMERVKGEAKEQ